MPSSRLPAAPGAGPADLHLHSTCSDGLLTVAELADAVGEAGLAVAALTDHDTLDGVEEFGALCGQRGVLAVAGVERDATPSAAARMIGSERRCRYEVMVGSRATRIGRSDGRWGQLPAIPGAGARSRPETGTPGPIRIAATSRA